MESIRLNIRYLINIQGDWITFHAKDKRKSPFSMTTIAPSKTKEWKVKNLWNNSFETILPNTGDNQAIIRYILTSNLFCSDKYQECFLDIVSFFSFMLFLFLYPFVSSLSIFFCPCLLPRDDKKTRSQTYNRINHREILKSK